MKEIYPELYKKLVRDFCAEGYNYVEACFEAENTLGDMFGHKYQGV